MYGEGTFFQRSREKLSSSQSAKNKQNLPQVKTRVKKNEIIIIIKNKQNSAGSNFLDNKMSRNCFVVHSGKPLGVSCVFQKSCATSCCPVRGAHCPRRCRGQN